MELIVDLQIKDHNNALYKKARQYLSEITKKLERERNYVFDRWREQWPKRHSKIRMAHGFPERLAADTVSSATENELINVTVDMWGH